MSGVYVALPLQRAGRDMQRRVKSVIEKRKWSEKISLHNFYRQKDATTSRSAVSEHAVVFFVYKITQQTRFLLETG